MASKETHGMTPRHRNRALRLTRRWTTGTMVVAALATAGIGTHLATDRTDTTTRSGDTAPATAGLDQAAIAFDVSDDDAYESDDDDHNGGWSSTPGFQNVAPVSGTTQPATSSTRAS